MSFFTRKRKRSVQLNNRRGSRRNRILLAISLCAIAVTSWVISIGSEVPPDQYLVAATNLSSNSDLNEVNLLSLPMDLRETENLYLQASEENLTKWTLIRPVSAGELIPLSSIALSTRSNCSELSVALGVALASNIKVGDQIDLWAANQVTSIETIPVQVVSAAELVNIKVDTDTYSQFPQQVEVCVTPAEVRSVVAAIATKSTVIGIRANGD
jgi:hypothetical protein